VLYLQHRLAAMVLSFALIDLVLGAFFVAAYRTTPSLSETMVGRR
jgi:hypothetical protein